MKQLNTTLLLGLALAVLYGPAAAQDSAAPVDCGRKFCNWEQAADYCKSRGGRLPTRAELQKIWNSECAARAGARGCARWYWSSEEKGGERNWAVDFETGAERSYPKVSGGVVRCAARATAAEVRAAAAPKKKKAPAANKARAANNPCSKGRCTWYEAADYCGALGGRLYTINELKDIYLAECTGARRTKACTGWYWSEKGENDNYAYGKSFYDGNTTGSKKTEKTLYARCARW
ncbi:MAG TPA: hypothetical protein DCZ92_15550 [Elusimicrobia bacterium]|nr:MAG: hypothetical protein A2016_12050 [Elusimicrobia bacterium GWF2_62_30]HBA62195.1 hypothetical protein [Elusimicrobiota bacterium]